MAQAERGTLEAFDDVGHREGLAGSGDAEQRDVTHALVQGAAELIDRLGLVAGGLVGGFYFEFHPKKRSSSIMHRQ